MPRVANIVSTIQICQGLESRAEHVIHLILPSPRRRVAITDIIAIRGEFISLKKQFCTFPHRL